MKNQNKYYILIDMQLIEKEIQLNCLPAPEDALFFDIETTGLSPKNSHIYLFGCVSNRGGLWQLRQWFIESPHEERTALNSINDYITKFKTLIHFNGDRFDIPYFAGRCEALCVPCNITGLPGLDLYKKLRRTKELLGLPHLHQKNFEEYVGNIRLDRYDGGQLIRIYREYQIDSSGEKSAALLLHNKEDVIGMPALMSLLPYGELFEEGSNIICSAPSVLPANDGGSLYLDFTVQKNYAYPLSRRIGFCNVRIDGNHIKIRIPVLRGTLKYFYPHARDYYYLPEEDMAIHKSVAVYVDKSHREKATADNCYIKKHGSFFRLPEPVCSEVFCESCGGDPYGELTEDILGDKDFWNRYLLALFRRSKSAL